MMMKFKLIFFSLFITLTLFGQRASDGEIFFNNKQFSKARSVYESLLTKKPNDGLYNFRYARCCYELKDIESAIVHFEMSGNKFPIRDLYLGELYFKTYRFDQSVMAYQNYIATLKPDDIKLPEYQDKVKRAEFAARLLAKVEDIAIVDSIVVDKSGFLSFYKFSSELGTLSQESIKIKTRRSVDKIKYTTQRQDRVYYSDSIHGQLDLFTSYKLLDEWSEPVSVSTVVNSPADENYPFLLLDGITMYFASDGDNSIGGYDLFITRYTRSNNSYLPPENIGFPFNSPDNDYMMVIDEQRKMGWFATDRNQQSGKVVIYTFVPNETKTIVRSEDKDFIRNAAQLKVYRKSLKTFSDSSAVAEAILPETDKQIEFVINDSLVYTNVNQFKSEVSIKLWGELHKLSIELNNIQKQLEDLRLQYSNAEKQEDKDLVTSKILEIEKKIIEIKSQITSKKVNVCNEENIYYDKVL